MNESRYIALYVVRGLIITFLYWLCQYLSFLNIFSIDFHRWKGVMLPDIAYIVIH